MRDPNTTTEPCRLVITFAAILALAGLVGCSNPIVGADAGLDAPPLDAGRDAPVARDVPMPSDTPPDAPDLTDAPDAPGCALGTVDLDGSPTNGCEYVCTASGATDEPDSSFVDANCDGIDGDVAAAIFVSPAGDDGNAGTMAAPVLTLAHALDLARVAMLDVYLDQGTYSESVVLVDGVDMFGGFDRTTARVGAPTGYWDRRGGLVSTIAGGTTAIEATGLVVGVRLDRLTITSADATTPSGASIAVWAHASSGVLMITNCTVRSGNGAAGQAGALGATGASGLPGSASGRPPAAGAAVSCLAGGSGAGGTGGEPAAVCAPGGPGMTAPGGGGAGGAGGTMPVTCVPGGSGGPGGVPAVMAIGANGAAGSNVGSIVSGSWEPSHGLDGETGRNGLGGGGGGAGGCGSLPGCGGAALGLPGGGGGSGGCGGGPGTRGTSGGASIGVLAIDAPVETLASMLESAAGGAGGAGANGGPGGGGGAGSVGLSGGVGQGVGGRGGNGGDGSRGGHGGSGGGGPSFAVAHAGTGTLTTTGTVLTPGTGGAGGDGLGNDGATGLSEARHDF